jgi:CheY-like chemotaxis protein
MPPYPPPASPSRILIVDDEPQVVDLFVDLLREDPRGFLLDTATDGYEALIKVGTFQPTLLILDALMPRLDGVEVCRRLKAAPETRGIQILGITGYPGMVPELMEAGADACLIKPLDLRLVQEELQRLLTSLGVSP